MTELTQDLSLAQARSLIDSYAFDLGRDDAEKLLKYWLDLYHASWIRLATIEALYLGRYKAISIEHILSVWLRIGNPNPHFTYEFERLICRKLPKHLNDLSDLTADATQATVALEQAELPEAEFATLVKPTRVKTPAKQTFVIADKNILNLEKAFKNTNHSAENNMSLISALGLSDKSKSEFTGGSKRIDQFIPLPDVSSFFNKLKTFGEE
ncbi:MAG TPA: hypothetical protein V6C71_12290 [Coleofasciculaceae cyanobacterium]|jgi:hypothetical protein